MADNNGVENWYVPDLEYNEEEEIDIHSYDISVIPNDFNISTIISFIEAGKITVPAFQRNFVWDIKRASRLIESVLVGLPIPQVFLYEEERNRFMVIDGQQRLMSLYYYCKGKFPKDNKKGELRNIFNEENKMPDRYLADSQYFSDFNLDLGKENTSKYNNRNIKTLDDDSRDTFFYSRPIRSVTIRQNSPDDDSAMFEIFNRLNTGGLNLKDQEIRTSLYHSNFYNMLYEINTNEVWRELMGKRDIDINMKDIEFLLRLFALTYKFEDYKSPMKRFLNKASEEAKKFDKEEILFLKQVFLQFFKSAAVLDRNTFVENGKFKITLFDAVFVATCKSIVANRQIEDIILSQEKINSLKTNPDFQRASLYTTTSRENVRTRIRIAEKTFAEVE